MKTYCGNCKKTLDQNDRFCRYCGSSKIIIEKDEEAPSFAINGDTLEKYNSGVSHALKDIREFLFRRPLWLDSDRSKFFDTMKKIEKDDLSSRERELSDTWKQMTALVIPQSVKRIDIQSKFSDFPNDHFYSISIHPDVHSFNFCSSNSTYIGYINIPCILNSYHSDPRIQSPFLGSLMGSLPRPRVSAIMWALRNACP